MGRSFFFSFSFLSEKSVTTKVLSDRDTIDLAPDPFSRPIRAPYLSTWVQVTHGTTHAHSDERFIYLSVWMARMKPLESFFCTGIYFCRKTLGEKAPDAALSRQRRRKI
jgi:hypothetical protein